MTMPKWHEAMYPILEAFASCDGYMTSTSSMQCWSSSSP